VRGLSTNSVAESPPHPALRADLSPRAGRGDRKRGYAVRSHSNSVFKQPTQFQTHIRIPAARCARVVARTCPENRGRRECRYRSLACENKKAHERNHHRFAETIRPSLRNGLRLISCSPRRPGSFATVACENTFRKLDASVGASGPHDFAVRVSIARLAKPSRPPHPAPNVRDDREAPLVSRKSGRICERAVANQPPVAGTEPVAPQKR
jgi:hypothetical protein